MGFCNMAEENIPLWSHPQENTIWTKSQLASLEEPIFLRITLFFCLMLNVLIYYYYYYFNARNE